MFSAGRDTYFSTTFPDLATPDFKFYNFFWRYFSSKEKSAYLPVM